MKLEEGKMCPEVTARPGPRIAVYTHDTFGLGHVRRCKHIVRAVSRQRPDAAILFITGSPLASALEDLPANADYLKIPTIVKTGNAYNQPSHLPIGTRAVTSLRKRIVRGAVDSFRPDLFLVDNFPLGSGKELLPTLEHLKKLGIPAVLGLRDIVDRSEVVRKTWAKGKIYDVLSRLYARILVYGTPDILDVSEAYALPSDVSAKVRYCGYVTSTSPPARDVDAVRAELGLEGPIVLATVGGGGDGFPLLSGFVQAVRRLSGLSALAITGPLMAAGDRDRIRELAGDERRIVIRDTVADLPSYLAAADLVVAMGGYNTVAELLALHRWALIVPRNWRYGEYAAGARAGLEWEQLMRAQALERLGLLQVLPPEDLSPESLSEVIATAMERGKSATSQRIETDGVDRAAEQLLSVIESRPSHAQV